MPNKQETEFSDFFEASKSITQEKMDAKKGFVSESEFLTSKYLKWLHGAPDASGNGPRR